MSILERLCRRKVRRAFAKHISPKVVKEMLRMQEAGKLPLRNEVKHFQFIMVHIEDARAAEIPGAMSKIIDTLFRFKATLGGIESTLITAFLGFPWPTVNATEVRRVLVSARLTEHGNLIHVAHGECDGLVGNFGNPRRFIYGAMIPNFSSALKRLFESDFSSAIEIPDSGNQAQS